MLLIESRTLNFVVDEATRLVLLDALRAAQFAPLIRLSRRHCFELLLAPAAGRLSEERGAAAAVISELEFHLLSNSLNEGASYTPGELFCFDGFVLYLIFSAAEEQKIRAGIIYGIESAEPLLKFELFCQRVRELLRRPPPSAAPVSQPRPFIDEHIIDEQNFPHWQADVRPFPQGLARFIERQDSDYVRTMRCKEVGGQRLRAAELLANQPVRALLRRAQEIRVEGYSTRRLTEQRGEFGAMSLEELTEVGLMQREIRVRCRQTGHALFDLPSADALALITVSRAKCSQCATAVADEVIEEVFNPTESALALLEDGTWLRNRVYQILRDLGVPECDIAMNVPSTHGESQLIANVCGDSFLFALRDGDLSPSYTRRVVETGSEIEARHVVVIVTGAAEDEGRMRLYEYAWRHAREGQNVEVSIIEGLGNARAEIERLFERSVERTLARDLFVLDSSLGSSASRFVLERFKLLGRVVKTAAGDRPERVYTYPRALPTDAYPSRQGEGLEVAEPPPSSPALRLTS